MRKIESDDRNLGSYLSIDSDIGVLMIPFSQRPYEWEKPQVERLFNDFVGLYNTDQEIHMLNFFTLSNEGADTKIFDGQQRTITSLLIIGAFINKLNQKGKKKAADQLYGKYISQVNHLSTSEETKYKLKFENSDVQKFFYKLLGKESKEEIKVKNEDIPTIKNLSVNYKTIKNLLDSFIEENSLDGEEIIHLVSNILDKTTLITITTYTDELAMAMFESLNNTGKQLENYYVLKNDLVMTLGEDKVKKDWNAIDSNLSSYDPSAFLLAISTVLTGRSTKSDSLNKIYKLYNKDKIEDMELLLKDILNASKKYLYIKNPVQLRGYHGDRSQEEYRRLITDVGLFITSQHYPLILALLIKDARLNDINNVLKHLLNLGIRNFYFKEKRANTIATDISDITYKFYKGELNINAVTKALQKLTINDDELKAAINTKNVRGSLAERRLKFIFRETFNNNDLKKELEIKNTLGDIHLEHILPKNPPKDSKWLVDFNNVEDREDYTTKIGNLTLLIGEINRVISNKDFEEKKDQYKRSHIPENQNIVKKDKWNKNQIDSRTKIMGKSILKYLNTLVLNK